jgi:hypothetical protein
MTKLDMKSSIEVDKDEIELLLVALAAFVDDRCTGSEGDDAKALAAKLESILAEAPETTIGSR